MKIHFVVVVIIIPPVIGVLTADIKKKKKNPQNFNFTSEGVLMGNMTSKNLSTNTGRKRVF